MAENRIEIVRKLAEDPTPLLGSIGGPVAIPEVGDKRLDLLQIKREIVGQILPSDGEKRDQINKAKEGKNSETGIEDDDGFHPGDLARHQGDQRVKEVGKNKGKEKTGDRMPEFVHQHSDNDHGNHDRGDPYRK